MTHRLAILSPHFLNPATGEVFAGGEQRVYRELARLAMPLGFQVVVLQESDQEATWTLPDGIQVVGIPRKRWWGRPSRPAWARQAWSSRAGLAVPALPCPAVSAKAAAVATISRTTNDLERMSPPPSAGRRVSAAPPMADRPRRLP